jgi:hypothetical protein
MSRFHIPSCRAASEIALTFSQSPKGGRISGLGVHNPAIESLELTGLGLGKSGDPATDTFE